MGYVWEILEEQLNFSTNHTETPDGQYGVFKDGRWYGVVGDLLQRTADVGVPLTIQSDRANLSELSQVYNSYVKMFVRMPEEEAHWNDFLDPFSVPLWMVVVVFVALLGICLWISSMLYPSISYSDCFLMAVGSFLGGQTVPAGPQATSWRLLALTALGGSLVVAASYSAALVARITVARPLLPFTTVDGFYLNSDYRMGMVHKVVQMFRRYRKDSLMRNVFEYRSTIFSSHAEGLRRMCREKIAYLTVFEAVMDKVHEMECFPIMLPEVLISTPVTYVLPNNSPYHPFLNGKLLTVRENGILQLFRKRMLAGYQVSLTKDFTPLSISHVMPILSILALGFAAALFIMLIETGIAAKKKANTNIAKGSMVVD